MLCQDLECLGECLDQCPRFLEDQEGYRWYFLSPELLEWYLPEEDVAEVGCSAFHRGGAPTELVQYLEICRVLGMMLSGGPDFLLRQGNTRWRM